MKLSYEYIRGLVDGEGCFSFYPGARRGNGVKYRVPAFIIAMNVRDTDLIQGIKETLGLRNKLYIRRPSNKDGYKRDEAIVLVVREFDQLKDIIIPLFYKKLKGYKGKQLIDWLEKIGGDPNITNRFKSLYRLYKWGMYDSHPKFINKFKD